MGFASGGGGVLTNHTHDTAVTNDGGSLAPNATMFGLSAGSVLFSDGSNIQELEVGLAADILTVNTGATAPEWVAPAGASGAWASEGNDINTTAGSSLDVTVTDQDVYQIEYHVADSGGSACLCMRLNDISTDTYNTLTAVVVDGGTMDGGDAGVDNKFVISNSGEDYGYIGTINVYKYDGNFLSGSRAGTTFVSTGGKHHSGGVTNIAVMTGTNTGITGAISKISLLMVEELGTAVRNIYGSMRVNSLSYS
jgi:hypothetical protein